MIAEGTTGVINLLATFLHSVNEPDEIKLVGGTYYSRTG